MNEIHEPRTAWLELSQDSSNNLIRRANQHPEHQVPLLLGVAGFQTQNVVYGLELMFKKALKGEIPELPVYSYRDHKTLHVAMFALSQIYHNQYPGLGSRIDGVGFIRHRDASIEEYTRGVEAVIRGLNPFLVSDGLTPIPTPAQYKYPLTGLNF